MKDFSKVALLLLSFVGFGSRVQAISVNFNGLSHPAIEIEPKKDTGLDALFVIYDASEIQEVTISGLSGTDIAVSKYSNLGGGYAIDIPFSFSNGNISISGVEGEMGYIVKNGDRNFCFWIVNYLPHKFTVNSFGPAPEQGCDATAFDFSGNGDAIKYYTIDGRQRTLSREVHLKYDTLEWNEENQAFSLEEKILEYESLNAIISVVPPFYCNSVVTLSGDRFLTQWGMPVSQETPTVSPNGIAVETLAEQTEVVDNSDDEGEGSNVISTETTGLGGSAPATIDFKGFVTDAVLHTEWQMASDPDFNDILYRWNEQDLSYTFNEEGQFYVRFIGSNADGSCEAYGETFTISIGASDLRIPNAFSPNNDGVNDIWKVGYRSLVEFKCWIFDSRGTQIYFFDRPEDGWDGKYRGKIVSPGVYYYVIEAKGADGKKYKKGGDINIVNYRKLGSGSSAVPSE